MTSPPSPAITTPPFTPPSSCFNTAYIYSTSGKGWYQLGPAPSLVPACYPPNYNVGTDFFYSPSVDCPIGYTPAAENVVSTGDVTETRATCCPTSNYVYQTDKTSLPYYPTIGCTNTATYLTNLPVVPIGGSQPTGLKEVGGGMNAYSIQIRWQASDTQAGAGAPQTSDTSSALTSSTPLTLSNLVAPSVLTTYTPLASSNLGSSSAPTSSTSDLAASSATGLIAPSSSPERDNKSGGMSLGARAGIGAAVAIAVVALTVIFILVYRLGKHRASAPHELAAHSEAVQPGAAQSSTISWFSRKRFPDSRQESMVKYGGSGTVVAQEVRTHPEQSWYSEMSARQSVQELPDSERMGKRGQS